MNVGDNVDVEAGKTSLKIPLSQTEGLTANILSHSVFLHLSSYLLFPPSPTPTSTSSQLRGFIQLCTFKASRLQRNERFNTTIKVRA